jgi:hypothetical protein
MEVSQPSGEEFPRPRPNLPLDTATIGRGSRLQPKPPKPFGGDWRGFNIWEPCPLTRVHYFRRGLGQIKGRQR